MNVFRPKSVQIRNQCIKFHHFYLFLAIFLLVTLLYSSVCMPTIDHIKCQKEEKAKAYTFTLFMFNKSLIAKNQSVFKDLNVVQMGIKKNND